MLVIHPQDPTTDFLSAIYDGKKNVTLLRGTESQKEVSSLIYHLPAGETILLLGHGSDAGLFKKEEDGFSLYIGRSMAFNLRRHPVIGIWCHANVFASQNRLHGLFSGMIISEMEEAEMYDVKTTETELAAENVRFAANIRHALDKCRTFETMRKNLILHGESANGLSRFNYNSFYCF